MDLPAFIDRHQRIAILTGAGCSTASGIPDYRDAAGAWKRTPPMTVQAFTATETARRRYWARSLVGWPVVATARPNGAHRALVRLQALGRTAALITQNVDGLHQAAGHRDVIDLHGRLDRVVCLGCGAGSERSELQHRLIALNPGWLARSATVAPDGDADLDDGELDRFRLAGCEVCGGVLKPDVVFFGESVPRARVDAAFAAVDAADALLIVGSSLMVYSGFRFARRAAERGLPIASVTLGRGRADELLSLRVAAPAAEALAFLLPAPQAA
ncbi:MAG: NAD-dependent protein deacetylase [Lautropia sp.]